MLDQDADSYYEISRAFVEGKPAGNLTWDSILDNITMYPGLAYFSEVERGGHFAAWEEPKLFSDEVRAAFRSLRK
jgi:pimeloyl-ACP methyl ester carboxylesterase